MRLFFVDIKGVCSIMRRILNTFFIHYVNVTKSAALIPIFPRRNAYFAPMFLTIFLRLNFKEAVVDADVDLFKKVHGVTTYQYMEKDPKMNQIFNKSMADLCVNDMNRILDIYTGFEGISRLVDVGGGNGQNLKMIISKHPSIKAINFDLPQVIENAPVLSGSLIYLMFNHIYQRVNLNSKLCEILLRG